MPPPLRPGDAIGVVAPAGPVRSEPFRRGLDYLRSRGYRPVVGEHVEARHRYLAGSDAERLLDVNAILADRSLKAIWCARGGYGMARIIERVRLAPLRRAPRTIVGYSDPTVLHAAVWRALRLPTLYGPNVSDLGDPGAFDEEALWQALERPGEPIDRPIAPAEVLRPGSAEGVLLGGCLAIIAGLCGTPWQLPGWGVILFWEEVAEEPYRIDRMLGQVRLAGGLEGIRGMVIGHTVGCAARDPSNDAPLKEIVDRHLGSARIPVVAGFPMGHGPGKVALPLGRRARVDTRAGRIVISPGA